MAKQFSSGFYRRRKASNAYGDAGRLIYSSSSSSSGSHGDVSHGQWFVADWSVNSVQLSHRRRVQVATVLSPTARSGRFFEKSEVWFSLSSQANVAQLLIVTHRPASVTLTFELFWLPVPLAGWRMQDLPFVIPWNKLTNVRHLRNEEPLTFAALCQYSWL